MMARAKGMERVAIMSGHLAFARGGELVDVTESVSVNRRVALPLREQPPTLGDRQGNAPCPSGCVFGVDVEAAPLVHEGSQITLISIPLAVILMLLEAAMQLELIGMAAGPLRDQRHAAGSVGGDAEKTPPRVLRAADLDFPAGGFDEVDHLHAATPFSGLAASAKSFGVTAPLVTSEILAARRRDGNATRLRTRLIVTREHPAKAAKSASETLWARM